MPRKSVTEFFKNIFHREPEEAGLEPECHTCKVPLAPESMGPRLLERCPKCRGTWISRAQLREILDQASERLEEGVAAVESDGHADIGHTFAPSRLARGCPQCQKNMDNFKFEETGVWIDSCPEGHGLWLDEGELRLLAQRKARPPSTINHGTVLDAVSDLIIGSL